MLETPSGDNPTQNAWLTIQLRVKLNFIVSRNASSRIVKKGAITYIKDADGYLFRFWIGRLT